MSKKPKQPKPLTLRPYHVAQIDMVLAIIRELERQHPRLGLDCRVQNAAVEAANLMVKTCATPISRAIVDMGLNAWWDCDESGLSSKTLAIEMFGGVFGGDSQHDLDNGVLYAPQDADDFRRCLGMLAATRNQPRIQTLEQALEKLAAESPEWAEAVNKFPWPKDA